MDFQLLRSLGAASYGGAAPGEVLWGASQVTDGDPTTWPAAFGPMGERLVRRGLEAQEKGHRISARDHYFRASMVLRAAEYFSDPFRGEHRRWGLACREAFIAGAQFLDTPMEAARIPYEETWLPAYYFRPKDDPAPRKTVVIFTGFDGCGEELYFEVGRGALERGYNALLIEGPGQTGTTRFQPELKFRPDWEKPTAAAFDWLLARPEVDAARIAIYGISLGGYFATRGAAFEPRAAALIANSPIVDLKAYQMGFFPPGSEEDPPDVQRAFIDEIPANELPHGPRSMLKTAFFRFGVESIREWLERLEAFRLGDEDLARLRVPCLAMIGEGEGAGPKGQAERFVRGVQGPAKLALFTAAEGADAHCQMGNLPLSAAVLFDWLDEHFA